MGFYEVLELCCFECLPNWSFLDPYRKLVLELCCFECLPNALWPTTPRTLVLELCCFECLPNFLKATMSGATVLELCCFECLPNLWPVPFSTPMVLELCCFECLPTKKETGFVNIQSLFLISKPSFVEPTTLDWPQKPDLGQIQEPAQPLAGRVPRQSLVPTSQKECKDRTICLLLS